MPWVKSAWGGGVKSLLFQWSCLKFSVEPRGEPETEDEPGAEGRPPRPSQHDRQGHDQIERFQLPHGAREGLLRKGNRIALPRLD